MSNRVTVMCDVVIWKQEGAGYAELCSRKPVRAIRAKVIWGEDGHPDEMVVNLCTAHLRIAESGRQFSAWTGEKRKRMRSPYVSRQVRLIEEGDE